MHNLFEYISEHILVVLILLISFFTVAYVQDVMARLVVLLLMVGFYVIYGILHHQQDKSYRLNVALEHLFVAAIVALVLFVSIR